MNQQGWERLVDLVDLKFGIGKHGKRQEQLEDNPQLSQEIDYVCFEREGKQYRLQRVSGPAIIDKKTIYHRAAGSSVRFENVYDTTQTSHRMELYLQQGDEWQKIDLQDLSL